MNIHYITVRCDHHSPHSGYDRFTDFIPNSPFPTARSFELLSSDEKSQLLKEAKDNVAWYEMPDLSSELSVNTFKPFFRKHVFHFLYGENSIFHVKKSSSSRKKIVATFHQPPEVHEKYIKSREPLKQLDGVVVVGTNQIPYFAQYMDRSRIFFVPHGVDTQYFTPPVNGTRDSKSCLFVGKWLRDFDTLRRVAQVIHMLDPSVRIDAISKEYNRPLLEGLPNLTFHSGIPEDDLLKKYQTASLLVLPVNDCTANNSAIEGISCGTPVVTTDIGGIRDYLDEQCAVFCTPKNADEMANAVIALLRDPDRRLEMEKHARLKAVKEFDWTVVSKTLMQAYKSI